MRRRDFLAALAGGLALPAAARLTAAELAPALGFGFSLYGLRSLPLADALTLCRDIGYDCVELPVLADWPADSARLAEADRAALCRTLEETGLRLTALMENLVADVDDAAHAANLQRLELAAVLGQELAPEHPPVIETVLGGRPAQWDAVKERMAERLADWAAVAEAHETRIALKAHVAGAAHRPEHPLWLAEQVGRPGLGCAFDFSHFQLRGVTLDEALRTLAPRTIFVHVKDARGTADRFEFLLPGDGETDYPALLRGLSAHGYRGDVVVEVSGQLHGRPDYDPRAAARRCYENLAPAFEQAGVRRRA